MDKIKYHIPQFVLGILFWILIVIAFFYIYGTIDKIDKIYYSIEKPQSCQLPYWIQDKIEWMYNNLDTERVDREIEVKCK